MLRQALFATIAALVAVALHGHGAVAGALSDAERARLLAAYPGYLSRIEGNELVWRDGTRMPLDDGRGAKRFEAWLDDPDIEDMLAVPYPAGDDVSPPARDVDPGRARNKAFFDKVYGDCRRGEVEPDLTRVAWLPKRSKQRLPFNRRNGAAEALAAVSRELDELPGAFDVFLVPSAGTYNCRVIAGTNRVSAHGHGIAIDIALKRAHYWRDGVNGKDGGVAFRNEIPMEIVRIFERHGFIWGGRWYHYDTMHFEYRPELVGGRGGEAHGAE
ncbi:M15 family metallopeptidase [Hyphomicrobium sp. 1Nfss2.1]|uniref:M15 family metallopeptidase n=1 Tax=Hyphomicrobium sp. 1Nfss2.1 TaxID=3413936 RepID=UPI003C7A4F59